MRRVRSEIAWRSDPATHASQVSRDCDVGYASNQIGHGDRAVGDDVAAIHALRAIVAQHVHVPGRYPAFRQIGEAAFGWADVDIWLFHCHSIDDRAPTFEGYAIALNRDDPLDVV